MAMLRKGSIITQQASVRNCPRESSKTSTQGLNGHAFVSEEESHVLVKVFLQSLNNEDKVYFSVKKNNLFIRAAHINQVIQLPANVNEGGLLAEYYGKFLRIVIPKVAIY